MKRALAVLTAAGAMVAAAAAAEESTLRLSVAQITQLPADVSYRVPIKLTITNTGQSPAYLNPSIADLSGSLDVFVRQTGTDTAPRQLFSVLTPYAGDDFEDLFKLMPGRRLRQTIWVTYEPLFAGEGTVEIWAEYDAAETGRGDARAFSGRLTSVPVVVPVRRRP